MTVLRRPPPELFNFRWVLPGRLAGMGWPPDSADAGRLLAERGVVAVVSLTELPPDWSTAGPELQVLHVPVDDMTPPSLEQVERVCAFTDDVLARAAGAVVYHCLAGIGRTGTALACYLVHQGAGAREALQQLRAVSPAYVQTLSQERRIFDFEWKLRPR